MGTIGILSFCRHNLCTLQSQWLSGWNRCSQVRWAESSPSEFNTKYGMVACWEWLRLPFSLGLPFSLCGLRSLHRSIFCGSGRLLTPSALSCFSTFGAISTVILGYFITIWSQWWPAPAPSKWPSGLLSKTWGLWLDMTCERTFPHLHWFATWTTIALHHSHLFIAEARVDSHCFALLRMLRTFLESFPGKKAVAQRLGEIWKPKPIIVVFVDPVPDRSR